MIFNIAVCDDEEFYRDEMKKFLEVYANECDYEVHIVSFPQGEALIDAVREREQKKNLSGQFQIIMLDVEMPGKNGIETADAIRQLNSSIQICFVTSFEDYALPAFRQDAIGYIVKPVSYVDLKKALDRAVVLIHYEQDHEEAEKRYIEIAVNRSCRIVDTHKVMYIEKQRNRCIFHCEDEEITCYESLSKIYQRLDANIFIYTHQGFVVNFSKIKEVQEKQVCLSRHLQVPLSRTYQKSVKKMHMDKLARLRAEAFGGA